PDHDAPYRRRHGPVRGGPEPGGRPLGRPGAARNPPAPDREPRRRLPLNRVTVPRVSGGVGVLPRRGIASPGRGSERRSAIARRWKARMTQEVSEETLPLIVSVDDHVLEAPTIWTDRLPAKYREIGPRVVRTRVGDLPAAALREQTTNKQVVVDDNASE